LSSRDTSCKEEEAVFAFKRALKLKVRFEVEKAKLTRREQVYHIACEYERSIGSIKKLEVEANYAKNVNTKISLD
jgi:hypothetical protein